MRAQWDDDESLLEDLREALQAVPPAPPEVVAGVKALYAWRTVDAELAALIYDSDLDDALLAGVRSDTANGRTLVYEVPGLSIEVDVAGDNLIGQALPPQPLSIEVQVSAGAGCRAEADDLGRFLITPVPASAMRLRCRTADGVQFTTPWARF